MVAAQADMFRLQCHNFDLTKPASWAKWLKTSLSVREALDSILGRYRPLAQLLSAQAIRAKGLGSIPGPVKSAECRQRLASRHRCDVFVFPRR